MKDCIEKNIKQIHIIVIILGVIFILLSAFHTNIWFDESYSVAISSNHNFGEIWTIGGHDVHPILYYWMLRLVSLIFGNHILLYRLFSSVGTIILGIIGYTHIRKDFGEKTGLFFSLFTFFLPINVVYAGEIRMYTWAMLFVTIMSVYAYRIVKEDSIKNWIIFAIFSLASAYIHYYGLITAGIVNLILFIYLVVNAGKERRFTTDLKKFIIFALIQVALYIPWLIYFILQVTQVSEGFWISVKFPDILIDIFTFQFTGNLEGNIYIDNIYAIIYGLIFCTYIFYLLYKNNKNKKAKKNESLQPAILAISIYIIIIIALAIISAIIPIMYARYFLVITGLFIFFIAFIMAKIGNKYGNTFICTLTIIVAVIVNINLIQCNYDTSNSHPIDYMKSNVQKDDILIFGNELSGFVVSVNFPQNMKYFYNEKYWKNVEEAYKAYGPNMKTVYNLDDLKDYRGRIWFISSNDYDLFEEASKEYNLELMEKKSFSVEYKKYQYTFVLADKIK